MNSIKAICQYFNVPRYRRVHGCIVGRYGSLSVVDGQILLTFTDTVPPTRYQTDVKRRFAIRSLQPRGWRNGLITCKLRGEFGFVAEIAPDAIWRGLDAIGALPVGKTGHRVRTARPLKSAPEVCNAIAQPKYYHGGVSGIAIGDHILPPTDTGVRNYPDPIHEGRVYITTDVSKAESYAAKLLPEYGLGTVYRVEPLGEVYPDDTGPFKSKSQFYCHSARVLYPMKRLTTAEVEAYKHKEESTLSIAMAALFGLMEGLRE